MIFDGWSIPVDPATERIVGSLDEVRTRHSGLSERLGFTVTAPALPVNRLGSPASAQTTPPLAHATPPDPTPPYPAPAWRPHSQPA